MSSSYSETITLIYYVVAYILSAIGLWGMFSKCGIKKWYSWIPVYRIYQLSICARKEDQGSKLMLASALLYVVKVSYNIFLSTPYAERAEAAETTGYVTWNMAFIVLAMALSVVEFVYHMRVYIGLCESFGKRKLWILMWLFLEPVAALIWGYSKSIQQIPEGKNVPEAMGNIS